MAILFEAIHIVLNILYAALVARVIISWLPIPRNNYFIGLLYAFTEPILRPIRDMLSRTSLGRNSMIDFSPIVAFLLLGLIRGLI